MDRTIRFACLSCGIRNGEVGYKVLWGGYLSEETVRALPGSIRAEHGRVSPNCGAPDIRVFAGRAVLPLEEFEEMLEQA